MPALVLAWIAAYGPARIENTSATPIVYRSTQSSPASPADDKLADKPQPVALASADTETTSGATTEAAVPDATPASHEPEPVVTAALTDLSECSGLKHLHRKSNEPKHLHRKSSSLKRRRIKKPNRVRQIESLTMPNRPVYLTEVLDECLVVETCIDRYLWALYQRTPKEDAIKTEEQRKVTVKKKGKLVTVTRRFTTLADEDFSWKDPKAAENAGMPMMDYVIGGVDRDFKLKLFHMLHAAEEAGLSPGITSAFRDDYRQSIASGLKAANDRSYHGGSFRGGYGHGFAADVVSVNGATRAQRLTSSETLWKWIDTHGKEFGIGRPYLGRDPPHVAPIDGKEYADHHPGTKTCQAASTPKRQKQACFGR